MRHVLCILAVVLMSGLSQARAELIVSLEFDRTTLDIGEIAFLDVLISNKDLDGVSTNDTGFGLSNFQLEVLLEGIGHSRQLWFAYEQLDLSDLLELTDSPPYVFASNSYDYLVTPSSTPGLENTSLFVSDTFIDDEGGDSLPDDSETDYLNDRVDIELGQTFLFTRLKLTTALPEYHPIAGDVFQVTLGPGTTFYDPFITELSYTFTPATITAVPEPSSLVLLTGMGLSMLVWQRRRRGCR